MILESRKNEFLNLTLAELENKEWITTRAINLCDKQGLTNLGSIIEFYIKNNSFLTIRNCGINTNKELIEICEKYLALTVKNEIEEQKESFLDTINILSPFQSENRINKFPNLTLSELENKEWITARAINLCDKQGLTNLELIIEFYIKKNSFLTIRNCGINTNKELIEICEKYLALTVKNEIEEQEESFLETINTLSPFQKATLIRHFEYLVSKLDVRSYNGLASIQESLNPTDIFREIFSVRFEFKKIRNIGKKSLDELDQLKFELIKFIKVLQTIPKEQLSKEYTKIIVKTNFENLPENFEEHLQNLFDESGKIKIFSLLNFLIKSGKIFSKTQQYIFEFSYTNNSKKTTLDTIANDLQLSRERIRQIKSKLEEDIQKYFLFVSNLVVEDMVNYNINPLNNFIVIDKSFVEKNNINEGVNFTTNFYSTIFGIFLKKTHSILGDNEIIFGKRKTLNQRKYGNCYLINSLLFDCFDFENFVSDIYLKVNEKITESFSLQFQGYLYKFLIERGKEFYEEIHSICNAIIFNEFELIVNNDGYLYFERTKIKQLHEYCFDILNEISNPLTVEELSNILNEKYPFVKKTISSIRSSLIKEKKLFICFGRTSTYALKKWETEKIYLKGGTIRFIVEEFLNNFNEPKHIYEITKHVEKYRSETYQRSILDNLRSEVNTNFIFFKAGFIGLKSKVYGLEILKYKSINGIWFTKNSLSKYNNWDYDKLINHLSTKYGYKNIQVINTLESKIKDGVLIITKTNKIKI